MRVGRGSGLRKTTTALGAALTLAALGAPAALAGQCDPVMPKGEVVAGMRGVGWTVSRGRMLEPFDVEVMGVLRDFAGAGRDVIVIEARSPAIDAAGGVWSGMSGSPVYVGGRLVGALALGFTPSSTVVGVTPAEDMLRLLSLRGSGTSAVGEGGAVTLPPALARRVSRRTGALPSQVTTMTPLRLPFSVSGLAARRLGLVRSWAAKRELPILPYAGSSAGRAVAPAPADPLDPGDNFAALASYGDVTLSAHGTTTYVCNGRALAFGHPIELLGHLNAGANAADALAIVRDPMFGPFKMAAVAEPVGVVDQDRTAGLRALLGPAPTGTPVRSTVLVPDTGEWREGRTEVLIPDYVGFVTVLHLISNFDATFDAASGGTASLSWVVHGTRADGSPWRLTRSDLLASRQAIAELAGSAVGFEIDMLALNPFEDVRVNGVEVSASLDETVHQYTVSRVLVAKERGRFRGARSLTVRPGMRIRVRVGLRPFTRGPTREIDVAFRVPRRGAPFGVIEIGRPGAGPVPGPNVDVISEDEDEGAVPGVQSFDAFLRMLQRTPRSDVLVVQMRTGQSGRRRVERRIRLDGAVLGGTMIQLRPPRGAGPEAGGPPRGVDEGEGP
jgi:SpoIVB peptidase S55